MRTLRSRRRLRSAAAARIGIASVAIVLAGHSARAARSTAPGSAAPQGQGAAPPNQAPGVLTIVATSTALTAGLVAAGSAAWWRDAGMQGFSFKHSGMFGRHTYAGGSDKLGHAFASYVGTRAISGLYGELGFGPRPRLLLGAATSFLLGNLVEVVDGFSPFKFEYGDVIANCVGIALGVLQQSVPAADALIGYRLGYVPSPGFLRGKKSYLKLVNDYSGMLFFLDFELAGLSHMPGIPVGPARYLLLGAFYGTTGYRPHEEVRRRHLGAFVGLNVPEILGALFGDERVVARAAATGARYYALPGTIVGAMRDLNYGMTHASVGLSHR